MEGAPVRGVSGSMVKLACLLACLRLLHRIPGWLQYSTPWKKHLQVLYLPGVPTGICLLVFNALVGLGQDNIPMAQGERGIRHRATMRCLL